MGGFVGGIKKVVKKALRFTTKTVSKTLDIVSFGLIRSKQRNVNLNQAAQTRKHNVRASAEPQRMVFGEINTGGVLIFADSSGHNKKYLHLVIALAGHACHSVSNIKFDDYSATDDAIRHKVRTEFFSGDNNQPATNLIAACPDWSTSHRGHGICYVYARVEWDANVWTRGIPAITMNVKGMKVYDPRDQKTKWSDNPALCILAYLRHSDGGMARDSEIDWNYWKAAANSCDEKIMLNRSQLRSKRYRLNTEVILRDSCANILEDLLTCCAGTLVYTNGKYRLHVGVATTPVGTLTEDDLRAPIKVTPRSSRAELFNAVRGTFINKDANWEACEFPMVLNHMYESQDGGDRISRNIELPCTTDETEARHLAKIFLEEARQSTMIEFPAQLSALTIAVWDVVKLTIAQLGYKDKLFRVISWRIDLDGGITLVLREYAAAIYDWNLGEPSSRDLAPNTQLARRPPLLPPSGIGIYSGLSYRQQLQNGKYLYRIFLQWEADESGSVRHYELNYRKKNSTAWQSFIIDGALTQTYVTIDPALLFHNRHQVVQYEFRLRSGNVFGKMSDWSIVFIHDAVVDAIPPKATNLRVTNLNSTTLRISWDGDGDEPINYKGFYIDYGKNLNDMTVLLSSAFSSPVDVTMPSPGSYFFRIRGVNLASQYSEATVVRHTIPRSPSRDLDFSYSTRAQNWKGSFKRCFINQKSQLENGADTIIGDLGDDISQLANTIGSYAGIARDFEYTTETFDLGKKMTFYFALEMNCNFRTYSTPNYRVRYSIHGDDGKIYSDPFATITTRRFSVTVRVSTNDAVKGDSSLTIYDIVFALDPNITTLDYESLNTTQDHYYQWTLFPSLIAVAPPQTEDKNKKAVVGAKVTRIHNGENWIWYNEPFYLGFDGRAALFRLLNENGKPAKGTFDVSMIMLRDTEMPLPINRY